MTPIADVARAVLDQHIRDFENGVLDCETVCQDAAAEFQRALDTLVAARVDHEHAADRLAHLKALRASR
jgi:hypothetical protein